MGKSTLVEVIGASISIDRWKLSKNISLNLSFTLQPTPLPDSPTPNPN